MTRREPRAALLVLADGSVFEGEAIGASSRPPSASRADQVGLDRPSRHEMPEAWAGCTSGEVVFNTVLSGYQEVITDPSYAGQIITFTYPHIGNYGTTPIDAEARRPFCRGVIVRDLPQRHSNWRARGSLDEYLVAHGVPGIAGIDTRRLTRLLRDTGSMGGAFGPVEGEGAIDEATLKQAAVDEPGTDGIDLVAEVTATHPYTFGGGARRVVALDFGVKTTMLLHLASIATVEVVPASMPAGGILSREPDGVFLSNGPGDPAMVPYAIDTIRALLGHVPVFGICLGHQLLSRALGGDTFKLPFGHHGGNHPVREIATGRVEITSQNHNFCVDPDSLSGRAEVTHLNLNDHTNEGMRVLDVPAFSVQYHPEAGPGPHDARYVFARFDELMAKGA